MTVGGVAAPAAALRCATGTGTIVDDNNAAVTQWAIDDVSAFEGNPIAGPTTAFTFTVQVSQPLASATTFNVTTGGGTAAPGFDYVPINNQVFTLPANVVSMPITVLVNNNNIPQANRTFNVTISNFATGVTSGKDVGAGLIVDDDATNVAIGGTIGFVSQSTPTNFNFPVVVSNSSALSVTGNYSTADGTATVVENDYLPVLNGNFPNNSNIDTFSLPVSVQPSVLAEGNETFTATLANTGVFSYANQTTATAIMVDTNVLNLTVGDAAVMENPTPGPASMKFKVYLNGVSGTDVTFNWTLNNGTALAGTDFSGPTSGSATITAGSLSTTISVPLVTDTAYDGNKSFTLTVSNPVGAGIQKPSGTGTIMDNNLTPTLTLSDAIVVKGANGTQMAQFTVFADYPVATAASPGGLPTTMTLTPSDFTATAAEGDYVTTPISVTLPAGATSVVVNVPIKGDTNAEGNETIRATITNPSNGDNIAHRRSRCRRGRRRHRHHRGHQ